MDISETLAPASDQLDAIELVSGPRIFTIDRVSKGSAEQPVNVHFSDFPRPWRPSKGMRRVLAACWGSDASVWPGRRVQLFFDPDVTFGKDKTGGTRIKALSHLDGPKSIPLLVKRGKSATFTVQPLPDAAPSAAKVAADETIAALTAEFERVGVPDDKRLAGANHYAGSSAASLGELTEDQAQTVLGVLASRPDVQNSGVVQEADA